MGVIQEAMGVGEGGAAKLGREVQQPRRHGREVRREWEGKKKEGKEVIKTKGVEVGVEFCGGRDGTHLITSLINPSSSITFVHHLPCWRHLIGCRYVSVARFPCMHALAIRQAPLLLAFLSGGTNSSSFFILLIKF